MGTPMFSLISNQGGGSPVNTIHVVCMELETRMPISAKLNAVIVACAEHSITLRLGCLSESLGVNIMGMMITLEFLQLERKHIWRVLNLQSLTLKLLMFDWDL